MTTKTAQHTPGPWLVVIDYGPDSSNQFFNPLIADSEHEIEVLRAAAEQKIVGDGTVLILPIPQAIAAPDLLGRPGQAKTSTSALRQLECRCGHEVAQACGQVLVRHACLSEVLRSAIGHTSAFRAKFLIARNAYSPAWIPDIDLSTRQL